MPKNILPKNMSLDTNALSQILQDYLNHPHRATWLAQRSSWDRYLKTAPAGNQ